MSEICDLGALPVWRGVRPTPDFREAPFVLERGEIGVIRQRPSEIGAQLVEEYASEDFEFQTSPPGSSAWGNTLAQKSLDGVRALCGDISGLDVLEIGGGTLYCARRMIRDMGAASITLVDPAAAAAPGDEPIDIRRQYFDEQTDIGRRFRLIVSLNTIEHVDDPLGFLRAARRHLAEDGVIFLKMPECGESFARGDLGLCAHEHLSYFTADSLRAALAQAGLRQIAEANYQGALQIAAVPAEPEPATRDQKGAELLAAFGDGVAARVRGLEAFADENAGGRVAFVGAAVGLCNMLHATRIAGKMEVEVFDGDDLKTGKYMPGIETPIRLTGDPRLESHSHVFITPLNFFDEISAELAARPGCADADIQPLFP